MKKNIYYLISALIFIFSIFSYGQTIVRCNTHEPTQMVATPKTIITQLTSSINIPVVFHVLHKTNGTGNVSDFQLQIQLDSLNHGFRGSIFSFYLAAIDRISDNDLFYWIANVSNNYSRDVGKAEVISTTYDIDPAHVLNIYIGSGSYKYEKAQGQYIWLTVLGIVYPKNWTKI